jgi:endonuclease G
MNKRILLFLLLFILVLSCSEKKDTDIESKTDSNTVVKDTNENKTFNNNLSSPFANAVTITHKYYITEFDTVLFFPVLVKFWLTKDMLDCSNQVERTNDFRPDPDLSDYTDLESSYKGTKYDRGHNMDAEDNRCDIGGMHESFYYSNMTPQTTSLNRGKWKALEGYCRTLAEKYDSVLVWCGSIAGEESNRIGIITVPISCWKILYIKSLDSTESYIMPNGINIPGTFKNYQILLDSLENLIQIKF